MPPLQRTFVYLTLAATGMAVLLSFLPAAGHDQIWFLLMAERWLGGATLYGPVIFDSNPPAVVWLSALPIGLGHVLHIPLTAAAKLLLTCVESAAAALSYVFLKRAWRRPCGYEVPALLFVSITLFYVVPARDLGQRDQMVSFLILPYILAAAADIRLHPLLHARTAAGVFAAIAICLKPHYALIPIAIELSLLLATLPNITRIRQLLRPELAILPAAGIAFLAAIHRFAPLYFTEALPIVRDTYWAIGHFSLVGLALEAIQLCILAAITVALYIVVKPHQPAIRILLVAAAAAGLAYTVQGTGWYYQQIPSIVLFGIALALLLLDLAARKPLATPTWLPPATAALTVLALALTTHFTNYPFTEDRAFALENPDPAFFTELAHDTPVAILTTSVDDAIMPVARYHLIWSQRTNNLWLLPAILRSESGPTPRHVLSPKRLAELEQLQHRWMVEDLNRWHPQLLLIARCQDQSVHCQILEDRHDDLLAWFARDPAFVAILAHYTYAGSRGMYDSYNLNSSIPPDSSTSLP